MHDLEIIINMIKKIAAKASHYINYLYWTNKFIFKYYFNTLQSVESVYQHYYLIFIIGMMIIPWLTGIISIGLLGDFLTYISFLILVKDKIDYNRDTEEIRKKISTEIEEESTIIIQFFESWKINHDEEAMKTNIVEELDLIRDYRYFSENKLHFLSKMIKSATNTHYDENQIFSIEYLFFNNIKTLYRAKYFSEFFDKKQAQNSKSKEYFLLQSLDALSRSKSGFPFSVAGLNKLSKERITQLINYEIGESITKENIDNIISDKNKYKKIKELIIIGLNKGLISDRSIESIIKNNNKLFFIIKYGEGTSLDDWPETEKAPFAKLLKENYFEQPFQNEYYTFIRDLQSNPIDTDPRSFINNLIEKHEENHRSLKSKYPLSKAIQTGPHYGLFSFIADKTTFTWKLSDSRDFNSFLTRVLIDEVIASSFGKDFIKANYSKIRSLVDNMEWYSLLSNDEFMEDIRSNMPTVNSKLKSKSINLNTITDFSILSNDNRELLFRIIFELFGKKKYSKAKNKKERETYIKSMLTRAYNSSVEFKASINELTK
jgi:hypothetical protein